MMLSITEMKTGARARPGGPAGGRGVSNGDGLKIMIISYI